MRVLIVDDKAANCRYLRAVLGTHGECVSACCGTSAFLAFEGAHAEGAPFDLICLDIMMPGEDGHQVLRRIRTYETRHQLAAAKVIMTTALDDVQNVLTAFKTGCQAYVVKPIDPKILLHEIEKLGLFGEVKPQQEAHASAYGVVH